MLSHRFPTSASPRRNVWLEAQPVKAVVCCARAWAFGKLKPGGERFCFRRCPSTAAGGRMHARTAQGQCAWNDEKGLGPRPSRWMAVLSAQPTVCLIGSHIHKPTAQHTEHSRRETHTHDEKAVSDGATPASNNNAATRVDAPAPAAFAPGRLGLLAAPVTAAAADAVGPRCRCVSDRRHAIYAHTQSRPSSS